MILIIEQESGKEWLSKTDQHFHCQFGSIPKDELKPGVYSNKQATFTLLEPDFHDIFTRLKRKAQVILPKDAGYILAHTGVDKTKTIVDAGGGSGWLTCFLAHYAKKVISCDINKEHLKVIAKNVETLGLKNVTIKEHDIYQGVPVKANIIHLDVPEPWRVLEHNNFQIGTRIVCYSPSITQSQQTVNTASSLGMQVQETIAVDIQHWSIQGKKVRPQKDIIGPTGFLTFIRVIA